MSTKETLMSRTDVNELAHRSGDGLEVTLWWRTADDSLVVIVADVRTRDLFQLEVDARTAMDAFHHPYAYAAQRGIAYTLGDRTPVAA